MKHEIYVFGSLCRGETSPTSDVDILVLPFGENRSSYPATWSVYSPELIQEYYSIGRLFAWHLHLEAKCIYSPRDIPFLMTLGSPTPYSTMNQDISDLNRLLEEAIFELKNNTKSVIYEMGIAYTAIRDIAMAASWALSDRPCFSSNAPFLLPNPCPLDYETYNQARLARHSSTRGTEINACLESAVENLVSAPLRSWVNTLRDGNEKHFLKQSFR